MTTQIWLLLLQNGIANSAIYALLGLAIVLVFTVTRVLFVPQGEFVTYSALTLAALELGQMPGTAYLLPVLSILVAAHEIVAALRARQWSRLPRTVAIFVALPLALSALVFYLAPREPHQAIQVVLALALVVPLGPLLYRLVFQPLADSSVLTLLFVAVALDFALVGVALLAFGAEGSRAGAFITANWMVGPMLISGQTLLIVVTCLVVMLASYLFFNRTIPGKALRATAINRVGARIVGIGHAKAGNIAFLLASLIGAVSGILIAPITPVYYDSGFVIGLKGFVGAIVGGMMSFPLAALGALIVGVTESFSSFWYSEYKEAIVFWLIIPVMIIRSLLSGNGHEAEE